MGETEETRSADIDQPVPAETSEPFNPIPFAEIDPTIFDAPRAIEKEPPTPPAPLKDHEYASPMFMKRSRAYEPLFELDLDDELEDDGGRKGKGRKRPRYSALNGRWRLNEESLSPEPEQIEGTPTATSRQNEDVVMQDTPERPAMADGGVQTDENDLAPIPSSPINTPSKSWSRAVAPSNSASGIPHTEDASKTDSGVQASPPRPGFSASVERHEKQTPPLAPNPWMQATHSSGFAAFGLPGEPSQNQEFGHSSSIFGTTSAAPSSQTFGQISSPFATGPTLPTNQEPRQASSLFGSGPVSSPSHPFQSSATSTGFDATSGSVRFGFTHEPQSTFNPSPFDMTQASVHQPVEPYPESSLDQPYPSNHSVHDSLYTDHQGSLHGHGSDALIEQTEAKYGAPEHLWPIGTQNFDASHAIDHANPVESLRTDISDTERSSPAMLPSGVEDGTRNADEMRQEGLLSQPVYRQGVPQEALPDQGDASAGEEDESVDSDEKAAYGNSDKGDDYDLRNYDRVSDDEEDFEDQDPLSDDELLDEGAEHWAGQNASSEEDYDEDEEDYEDDNENLARGPHTYQSLPVQPATQKNPIVIDLLSDSDDDEPPVPPIKAPRSQVPMHESEHSLKSNSADISEEESVGSQSEQVAQTRSALPFHDSAHNNFKTGEERDDSDQEVGELEDEDGTYSDEEQYQEKEDESEPDSEKVESDGEEAVAQEANAVNHAEEPKLSPQSIHGAVELNDGHQDTQADAKNAEARFAQSAIGNGSSEMDVQPQNDSAPMTVAEDDDHGAGPTESFQTQPDEMVASFQFQIAASPGPSQASESHVASDVVMKDASAEEDTHSPGHGEAGQEAAESEEVEKPETSVIEHDSKEAAEHSDIGPEEEGTRIMAEEVTLVEIQEDQEIDVSMDQHGESSAVETSKTTIVSHVETQSSHQEVILETQKTDVEAELVLTKPVAEEMETEETLDPESVVEDKDVEMVDADMAVASEDATTQAGVQPTVAEQEIEQGVEQAVAQVDGPRSATPSSKIQEPSDEGTDPASPPKETAVITEDQPTEDQPAEDQTAKEQPAEDELAEDQSAEEKQQTLAQSQLRHVDGDDDDQDVFHEAPETPERASATPVPHPEDSFVSADSSIAGTNEAEETETSFTGKPTRGGKKARKSSGPKSAKTASGSQKAQRQSSRQSSRQVSAQETTSSQRKTRSKTMSFQAASPNEDKEDMSIQLARAALKSPTSKKSKVSITAAKRVGTGLVKRLENDLADCVGLNDLRKYNANLVDVAVVATSANVPPKRTPAREYASSFTVTDPTIAPDGVVEVDLYHQHKEHLPVVKTGDSVLLRNLLVVSLPGRGFGLKTKKDTSSWAVFKAEGGDEPEVKDIPVEMSETEVSFMLDVRGWYANLDDTAKGKIGVAVGQLVEESGKESREKK